MKKEYSFKKAKRGPVAKGSDKVSKTIRIDLDIVAWLLKEAEQRRIPYQTLINSLLKEAMDRSKGRSQREDELRAQLDRLHEDLERLKFSRIDIDEPFGNN